MIYRDLPIPTLGLARFCQADKQFTPSWQLDLALFGPLLGCSGRVRTHHDHQAYCGHRQGGNDENGRQPAEDVRLVEGGGCDLSTAASDGGR